jgi:hypothetical protein
MTPTFRQFINLNDFPCSLLEQDAAPTMGAAPQAPDNPDNKPTNKHHFDFLKRQLGIGDNEMTSAIESTPIQVFKVPDYSNKWGYLVVGDCTAIASKRSDGNYDVTFQLFQKHIMNPNAFILSYKKGENPIIYKGDVEDETEIVTEEELQDMVSTPLAAASSTPSGPPGLSAGAPPM